jgi:hypothetical protein
MALHFLSVVLAALYTREAHSSSHLTNSGMIEWERRLDITVSVVRMGWTFSKCINPNLKLFLSRLGSEMLTS